MRICMVCIKADGGQTKAAEYEWELNEQYNIIEATFASAPSDSVQRLCEQAMEILIMNSQFNIL